MENIIVTVRFKPNLKPNEVTKQDTKSHLQDCWRVYKEPHNVVSNLRSKQNYIFDYVFAEDSSNQQIFNIVALPLIQSSFEGINSTIFAYGQTSSGKTFTIRGTPSEPGLIIQALSYIFDYTKNNNSSCRVKISYLEVYNEQINDLLDPTRTNLEIREHPERGIYVERLSELEVDSESKALELLSMGESLRKTGETQMNAVSSRSHSVFKIFIETTNEYFYKAAQLNFVDLAGSEGMQKAKTEDLRLREGSNINKSLLSLSSVIQKLSDSKGNKGYINFRDSKMTRLLQPALSGNSRTAVICTVNPEVSHYQESNNTLLFGIRAKHIKNDVKINQVIVNEQHIQDLSEENKKLVEKIFELEKNLEESTKELFRSSEEYKKNEAKLELVVQMKANETEELREKIKGFESEKVNWVEHKKVYEQENEDNMKKIGEFFMKLSAAQERIKELEGRVDSLSKQNVNGQNYINYVLQEVSDSKLKIADQDKQIEDCKCKEAEFVGRIGQLEAFIVELNKTVDFKDQENFSLAKDLERLLKENQEFSERIRVMQGQIDEEIELKRALEADKIKIVLENGEMTEKLQLYSAHIQELKDEIKADQQLIEENEFQKNSIKETLQAAQVNLAKIEESCKDYLCRLTSSQEKESFLTSQIKSLQESFESLKTENLILKNKMTELENSLMQTQSENLELSSRLANELNLKENLLAAHKQELLKKSEEIQTLSENLKKPSFESEETSKKNKDLQAKCSNMEIELNLALAKIPNLESEIAKLTSLIAEKESEVVSLMEITQYKTNLLRELQNQLKDSVSKVNFLESANMKLISELDSLKGKNKSFVIELNSYVDGLNQSEKDFSGLKSELDLKNNKIEELQSEIKTLKSEIKQLQDELDLQINEKLLIEQENFKLEYMFNYKDNSIVVQLDQKDSDQAFAQLIKDKIENLDEFENLKEKYLNEVSIANSLKETIEENSEKIKQLKEENLKYAEELGKAKESHKEVVRIMNSKRVSCGVIDENILQPIENNEKYKLRMSVASLQNEIRSLGEEILSLKRDNARLNSEREVNWKNFEDLVNERKVLRSKVEELEKKNAQYYNEIGYLIAEKEMKLYEDTGDKGENKKLVAKKKEMKFLELGNSPKCRTQ